METMRMSEMMAPQRWAGEIFFEADIEHLCEGGIMAELWGMGEGECFLVARKLAFLGEITLRGGQECPPQRKTPHPALSPAYRGEGDRNNA